MLSQRQNFHKQTSNRYDKDEGFSDQQCEHLIINKQKTPEYKKYEQRKFIKKFHEAQPKHKLILVSIQKPNPSNKIYNELHCKQRKSSSLKHQSLEIKKQASSVCEDSLSSVIKTKRTLIGQNITLNDNYSQIQILKKNILLKGGSIVYEKNININTHGHMHHLLESSQKVYPLGQRCFLKSKYNFHIRQKIKNSIILKSMKIHSPPLPSNSSNVIEFSGDFESGNLLLTAKTGINEYQLYMSIDTNTKGHQNWFYFRAKNMSNELVKANIKICNFQREMKMFYKGACVYSRNITNKESWILSGENFSLKQSQDIATQKKKYQMSFQFCLKENNLYEISLLPAYSYSQMLKEVQQLEEKPNVKVQILGYSLAGLAIPLVTIGSGPASNKNVTLVSCRIHPGQTVASYACKGLMNRLTDGSSQVKQFLERNIIKIIPMLNPDGVLYGNFRTSFIGADLNRSFDSDDEILFPETYALKQLGRALKQEFNDRFCLFIDLHGHSSKKNIFCYGPEYQHGHSNFYSCRLLPKILHSKSKYFKYQQCTFKVQQYKEKTARAFFLNMIGIFSYTMEASYSLYDCDHKEINFKVQDWINFGSELADSIALCQRLLSASKIKNNADLRRVVATSEQEDLILIKKFSKQIKKYSEGKDKSQNNENGLVQDSDGESSTEDMPSNQKIQLYKKVMEVTLPKFLLPKMLKQSIIYPTVTPTLFQNNQQSKNIKLLYTKRNKFNTLRMINISNTSGNLANQICQLEIFKPYARNFRNERKFDI